MNLMTFKTQSPFDRLFKSNIMQQKEKRNFNRSVL